MKENTITNEKLKTVLEENTTDSVEKKWLVKYHKDHKVSNNVNVICFGEVEETAYDPETNEAIVKPNNTVDEFTFYYLFCTINNIIAKDTIAATQLLVLAAIMAKDLDFSLPIDSKDGKLTDIADELSDGKNIRTANSIYQSVKRLRDKGYLVEIEDRLIVPNANFQRVRHIIKRQLKNKGFATFDYLFKCFIAENG